MVEDAVRAPVLELRSHLPVLMLRPFGPSHSAGVSFLPVLMLRPFGPSHSAGVSFLPVLPLRPRTWRCSSSVPSEHRTLWPVASYKSTSRPGSSRKTELPGGLFPGRPGNPPGGQSDEGPKTPDRKGYN
jgi:hypothetical protein